MNIAVLTDSSSGLNNQEQQNLFVLPLPIIFSDNSIVEDNKLNLQEQNEILLSINDNELKSSFLNNAVLSNKIENILQEYDYVIYLPIAANLSSQYQNSLILLENPKFKNKLLIVKHYFTGIQLAYYIFDLLKNLTNKSKSIKATVTSLLKKWENNSLLMVIPGDIKKLVRSGRVNKIIVNFFDKRKLKIGIFWSFKPKKIIAKNYENMLSKYIKFLKKNFITQNIKICLAYNSFCTKEIISTVKNKLKEFEIIVTYLPTIFAIHGGNDTIGLVAFKI